MLKLLILTLIYINIQTYIIPKHKWKSTEVTRSSVWGKQPVSVFVGFFPDVYVLISKHTPNSSLLPLTLVYYNLIFLFSILTLKVLVTTIDAQWEGMGM